MLKKVAVLSGATRGVGEKVTLALAENGYHVCLLTHNQVDANRVKIAVEKRGSTASIYTCNVENCVELANTYQRIYEECGQINLVFTNMGLMPESPSYPKKLVGELTGEQWHDYLNSALLGVVNSVNQVIPYLAKNEKGGFIFTTALWGVAAQKELGLYTVSRAGIQALIDTVNLEAEQAGNKIQAYLLQPRKIGQLSADILNLLYGK